MGLTGKLTMLTYRPTTAGYVGKYNRSRLLKAYFAGRRDMEEGYRTAKIVAMSPNKNKQNRKKNKMSRDMRSDSDLSNTVVGI